MAIIFLLIPLLVLAILGTCLSYLWRTRRSKCNGIKRTGHRLLACVGAIASSLLLAWFAYANIWFFLWARAGHNAIKDKQVTLLYRTNHEAIRDACRNVLSDTNTYATESITREHLPPVIRDLSPSYVMIYPDRQCISIEMGGGFFHYGFQIYAEGTKGNGTKELMPGMWYYSEDAKIVPDK